MGLARSLRRRFRQATRVLLAPALRWHRRSLAGTCFVAITGSTGKTTTKSLLAAVLPRGSEVVCNPGSDNLPFDVMRTIFSVRERHAYCVQELGAWRPGSLDRVLRQLQPEVTVVTQIGVDHLSAFADIEAIVTEKVKAVKALPGSGIAVLNADDPRVLAMRECARGRVFLYGASPDAELRVLSSAYSWPGPLRLEVSYRNERQTVRSPLHGRHWASSVAAAIATGLALRVSLDEAIAAIASVPPERHRLSTMTTRSGITFLLDDWKANEVTLACAFEVLGSADAKRRIAVLGQVADSKRKPRSLYADLAREARKRADEVILVGRWARYGLRARTSVDDTSIRAFSTARGASLHLGRELRAGDLVLIASSRSSHLSRIAFAAESRVDCWRELCGRTVLCDRCSLLRSG